MKKIGLKAMIAALAITAITGAFIGCGSKEDTSNKTSENISGSITAAGSSALQPLAEQIGKKFTEKYPEATVNVQGGGSGTGLRLVSEGTVQIGNSDVTADHGLQDAAKVKELVDHKVCAIGFSVVVNHKVNTDNLTKDQIQKIFTGEITNWKDITGQDMPINVINRPKGSGTRATFKDTVMGGKDEKEGLGTMQDSNKAVEKSIQSTDGSISYLALSYLTNEEVKKSVKTAKIDGIEPNKENIASSKYPFWSYEHMYTKGEATGVAKAFIEFMMNDENKTIIEKLGYIAASDIKAK